MRAVFGPAMPMLYAPMPPADWAEAQSAQATAEPGIVKFIESADWRHVPAFLKPHHAGSGPAVAMSMTTSLPDVAIMSSASTYEPTRMFEPELVLQAKLRFVVPPSPKQFTHLMLQPGSAAATPAVRARSMPHSRVTFFIFCLRYLFLERGG